MLCRNFPRSRPWRRTCASARAGRVIERADVAEFSVLKTYDPPLTALAGATITSAGRHGKFLDLGARPAGGGPELHLIMHLARAGLAALAGGAARRRRRGPVRGRWRSGYGLMTAPASTSPRRARASGWLSTWSQIRPPSPASPRSAPTRWTPHSRRRSLGGILAGRRTQIKGVLRDQKLIAGIGNAYSDEVLHAARMSPFRLASSLTAEEVAALHASS